jgi:hypothetical protein
MLEYEQKKRPNFVNLKIGLGIKNDSEKKNETSEYNETD